MAPEKRPERSPESIRAAGQLSTRDLAHALGVSESSVKRWADGGVLRVVRTVGGHRRIPLAEAVRFVRESRATLVQPAALGLARASATARGTGADADHDQLAAWLAAGSAAEARGFLNALYLRGRSVAAIVDRPLRAAMQRVGERWLHEPDGILVEHRATDICIQWLSQLRAVLAPGDDAPVALGGAPAGDPYVLPTLAVAAALEAEGLRAINLGPETPIPTLLLALERERPAIVWVSASTEPARDALVHGLEPLAAAARARGARLILGGRALEATPLDVPADVHVARSMGEVAAFAQGLRAGRAGGASRRSQTGRPRAASRTRTGTLA